MLNGIIWKNRVCPSHKKSAPLGVKKKCQTYPLQKVPGWAKKVPKLGHLRIPVRSPGCGHQFGLIDTAGQGLSDGWLPLMNLGQGFDSLGKSFDHVF